jgi:hypothetical protein
MPTGERLSYEGLLKPLLLRSQGAGGENTISALTNHLVAQ